MSKRTNEFYNGRDMRITAGSAADIARVSFFGNTGDEMVRLLLEREENPENPAPYTYAGRHMGMPRQDVWAITRDGSSIEPHIPNVVCDAQEAIEIVQKR